MCRKSFLISMFCESSNEPSLVFTSSLKTFWELRFFFNRLPFYLRCLTYPNDLLVCSYIILYTFENQLSEHSLSNLTVKRIILDFKNRYLQIITQFFSRNAQCFKRKITLTSDFQFVNGLIDKMSDESKETPKFQIGGKGEERG